MTQIEGAYRIPGAHISFDSADNDFNSISDQPSRAEILRETSKRFVFVLLGLALSSYAWGEI